jgi:hypothetical protein
MLRKSGTVNRPTRTLTHKGRILALLRERGSRGVLGSEFYEFPHLYGRRAAARIAELRREGHNIMGEPRGGGIDWRYWLIERRPVPAPEPEEASVAADDTQDLPLFVGLRSERT